MNDGHIWWYITRASALIAWTTLTFSVVWGILLSTRVMRKIDNPGWLQDLHRYLGGLTVFMVLLHMVSLMLDGWLQFSWQEVLVPLATDYRPIASALGIISFYIVIVVQLTSMVMNKLPRAFWKAIHYLSYTALFLVAIHAGWAGTDVTTWWYRVLAIVLISVAAIAAIVRILTRKQTKSKPKEMVEVETPVITSPPSQKISMVVAQVHNLAEHVVLIKLLPLGGGQLPVWQPGAHITVYLPNGLERQYSLCGDPAERTAYEIAVLKSPTSEGGSLWIHNELRPGMTLEVSAPRNHFELEPASEYVFIAGGIGITPIKAMIESLPPQRKWKLIYLGKNKKRMAFVEQLVKQYPHNVSVITSGAKKQAFNLENELSGTTAEVYCCGPESLMNDLSAIVPSQQLHLERFAALERTSDEPAKPVELTCKKSHKTFTVPEDQSLLEAMEENGIPILGSCRKGVCGSCEVRVLQGTPIHLDSVMDDDDKDKNSVMYPCVSRCSTDALVLDI